MKLGLHMCESRDGVVIADFTDDAEDVVATTGDHGFHTLSFFVAMGTEQSFQFYNLAGVPYIGLFHGGDPVWEGRAEDIAIVDGGINVVAFGCWSAFSDAPYTAMWSMSSYGPWQVLNDDQISVALPDRWTLDNNNRLYFAPNKNEQFSSAGAIGMIGYTRPDRSEKYILEVDFSYELTAASPWTLRMRSYGGDAWTDIQAEWTLVGDGTTQSGSTSITLVGSSVTGVAFMLFYNGSSTAYTGETGDTYAKITSVRVKAVTTATVTAKVIVEDLISYISDLNGAFPDDGTAVFDPGVDLDDAVFEDVYPADIIYGLALMGDDSDPPKLFEASTWEGGYLHFHEVKSYDAAEWFTDVDSIELERSLNSLTNSYYTLYGGGLRTATATDADSVAIHGITRREMVSANTESQTQAEIIRDARIQCKCGRPRAKIEISGLFDKRGGEYGYWNVRAGDCMTLRNLNPDLGELDNLRTFMIDTTEFDLKTNTLIVTPEELPSVELIAAQGNM